MQKDTKTIKIGQMNSLLGPKQLFYIHNGGHLWQSAPSLILNWLHNREKLCQLPLNIQKDTKIIQIDQLNSMLGRKPNFTWKTASILNSGCHIGILNGYFTVIHEFSSLYTIQYTKVIQFCDLTDFTCRMVRSHLDITRINLYCLAIRLSQPKYHLNTKRLFTIMWT